MNIFIRECTIDDLEALQKISIETFTDTFAAQNTQENLTAYLEKAYTLEKLTEELQQLESFFFFIYMEEELAGYLKLNINAAQTEHPIEEGLEVERIYIRSNFKRNGLGNRLLEKAIALAKEKKKKNIWLGVWEENLAARKFYQKMGFVQSGQHSFFMGEDEQIDLIMVKPLAEAQSEV
ncbi:GNAT family N-acetyltransferase [uncultured Enterococcus sp.]|uniref:GNAT family N-acetyltransferase n=1 Tax=uncultured Enterococcus sp. TaxID=167972 RepID=UPI002AA8202A|nr:GNAT family N-acetyltransferase [uncultured Enterococcus sp.]